MNLSGGFTDVYGPVTMSGGIGEIIASGGGVTTFYDDVVHNGAEIRSSNDSAITFFGTVTGAGNYTGSGAINYEGIFSPGASPASVGYDGSVILGENAALVIEIAGLNPGSQHDQMNIAEGLKLGGTLDLRTAPAFTPVPLNTFTLATFGSLDGAFETILNQRLENELLLVPDVAPGEYNLVTAIPGDFTLSGEVGVPDLIVWAQNFGSTGSTFQLGDANLDATTDVADLIVWAQRFGQTAADFAEPINAIAYATAVPEPSGTWFWVAGVFCATWRERRSDRKRSS
ncbi:MAG: hypothetical protein ACYTGQ_16260 [Planctomycetota bacterium]